MIETPRLLLSRPSKRDMSSLKSLWRDKKVRQFLGGIISNDMIKLKLLDLQSHWDSYKFGQWIVFEKTLKEIIGLCGLHHSDDGIELSYMFFPHFWGKGYAYEATTASLEYGFYTLKIDKIIAITQSKNIKSCQLLKKVGMQHIKNFERFNADQRLFEINNSFTEFNKF